MTLSEIVSYSLTGIAIIFGGGGYLSYRSAKKKEKADILAQKTADAIAANETDEERAARISDLQVSEIKRLSEGMDKLRTRVDALEARDRAFMNILNDAARQWPADHKGPVFHAVDLAVINGDMPSTWALGHA